MAEKRIKIAKDKAKLVKELKAAVNPTGTFETYVEVMVFAATLGAKRKKRVPIGEVARDLDPIRRDYFDNKKCEMVINLLAVFATQDQNMLTDNEDYDEQRIKIFEEYANGGLEILKDELRGAVNYAERILLILIAERMKTKQKEDNFDLSSFLF